MNFEKIDEDIYDGKSVNLSNKEAMQFLFYMAENYARNGKMEDFDAEYGITAIEELVEYMALIRDTKWSRVEFNFHPMASTEIVIREGVEPWMSD